jgi:predicted transcriptional regulator
LKGIDIMEKKMTKREKFEMLAKIAEVKANPVLAEFIEHELELLAKKNASGSGKLTAVQVANNGIKEEILECMAKEPDRLFTISEMMKLFPCCAELSNQRVSALVRQLKEDGKVERFEEKRKAVFRIAR